MDQLLTSLPGFRWQDAFDILLNAYILFRLYVLFRGTHVFRVLLGVFVLWVLSRSAQSMGLVITNWAMQGVITAAFFIIIIVFRNEISSVVQTRDMKSFLWGIPRHQLNTPLGMIVESVNELAEKKIGALIVLPLKQGLESIVQGGISVNAALSREMLVSIFWPDNPLHDGAAIIQGNRITRSGVILPLSQEKDLSSFFGTRHRAALGLSQLTDALVIVVSEERGKVSLAKEGEIHTINKNADLEKVLQEHAGGDTGKKGLRHQTLELILAAAICLSSTTGLWFSFSKGMETLATHEVPIEFMNPYPEMDITAVSVSNVKLLISGARPLINSLKTEQINVKLSLADAKIGTNTLFVSQGNITLPPGIQLKKIDPPKVDVTLDALMEKELPIQPQWTGKLPEGLIMRETRTIPPRVKVIGRELALNDMATVFTEKIPLDNLAETGTISVTLMSDPAVFKTEKKDKILVQYFISKKEP
ncbi:diadenylate cyclase CdaA [Desulfospira joergensenii]|uniref:diadenylate cyclase CdaA n=1 Tax=Desulfospira joergensenii TaxID=53329 RepID=UPI000526156B|nr:diadenylate cyclase CdaA [Desulfospira joergensenii]